MLVKEIIEGFPLVLSFLCHEAFNLFGIAELEETITECVHNFLKLYRLKTGEKLN